MVLVEGTGQSDPVGGIGENLSQDRWLPWR
jgi:hypothetical protein